MIEFIKSSFTKETFDLMKYEFFNYNGNIPTYFVLFVISLIFILFYNRKEKEPARFQILLTSIILLIIVFFPPSFNIIYKFIGEKKDGGDFWRVYWMLPIGPSLSYMVISFIKILNKEKNKLINIAFIGIFSCIIIITGQLVYTKNNFQKVYNYSKCPDEILDIIQLLSLQESNYKKVMTTIDVSPWPRQLDSNIILYYSHEPSGSFDESIRSYDNGNINLLIEKLVKNKCNYFITHDFGAPFFEIYPELFDYIGKSTNGNYKLFKVIETKEDT